MIEIRKYHPDDAEALQELFFNTIRRVNSADYDEAQVRAWAPDDMDEARWRRRMGDLRPFICTVDDQIAGYADLQPDGYIDHFYVHHERQGEGIGKRLFAAIETNARDTGIAELFADVSITAKPFFLALGFQVVQPQKVAIGAVELTNYRMRLQL